MTFYVMQIVNWDGSNGSSVLTGDAAREQHADAGALHRLPRSTEHGHGVGGDSIRSHGVLRLPQVRRQNRGQHHAQPTRRPAVSINQRPTNKIDEQIIV